MAWWLSSHDQQRHVSREGDGSARDARLFAAILLALPGPILLYQGEELGQPQADLTKQQLTDPFDLMYWPDAPGREAARTPMAWDEGDNHGFTEGTPWLPMVLPEDGPPSLQDASEGSVLAFYRNALHLRHECDLGSAHIVLLESDADIIEAELTTRRGETLAMVANLGDVDAANRFAERACDVILQSAEPGAEGMIPARSGQWLAF
jgi:alpha-glucosidase